MNSDLPCRKTGPCAYIAAILGTFLIVLFLTHVMQHNTRQPSIMATRSAERMKIKAEFMAANAPYVDDKKYEWSDEGKGFVRIPIKEAMDLVLSESQNPAAARSNIMARAAKEFAPAPKPPEQKNAYE